MRTALRALLPLLVALPTLASCAVGVNPVSGARRAYAYSWQQEIQLGRDADREIVEQFGVVDDPELAAYVEGVGEAVLAHSHLRREGALPEYRETVFTFRVLDSEIVNAFALPGGYVYVTRGLLAHLENEAQLAVVLGHEVAHVAARHSSKDAFKAGALAIGIAGAEAVGEEVGGTAGALARTLAEVGGTGLRFLMLRHGRDDERESDRLGVEYATRAGYEAAEGAHFFTALRRMQRREGWFPSFLSTHPDPGRREETVRRLAEGMAPFGPGERRVGRDAYLARIDGLVLGEDPRHGYLEDGVFYHPAARFHFAVPRGWGMTRDGREVELAPARENVAVLVLRETRHATAAAAAAAFVAENELSKVSSSTPAVPGYSAARVDATARHGEDTYRVAGVWIEHEGAVLRFLGLASPERARTMEHAVSTMVSGLRPLTDPQYLDVRPAVLELVTVRHPAPFRELVGERVLPEGMDLDALAIMNGVDADEVVPAGGRLKLPG